LTFDGLRVDAPKKPAMVPLTARRVFDTFHFMHDQLPFSVSGHALLGMDTSAPAGPPPGKSILKPDVFTKRGVHIKRGKHGTPCWRKS
jgi:hypothetical protein